MNERMVDGVGGWFKHSMEGTAMLLSSQRSWVLLVVLSSRISKLLSSIEFNQLWIGKFLQFFQLCVCSCVSLSVNSGCGQKTNQLGNLKFKEVWNLCALVWITPNLSESDPNWGWPEYIDGRMSCYEYVAEVGRSAAVLLCLANLQMLEWSDLRMANGHQ